VTARRRAETRDLWWFRANVPCLDACPVKTDAGRYVQLIAEGDLSNAYRVARAPNPIASVCGRACGAPCEDACRRGKIDSAVTIRALKRFVCERFGPESLSAAPVRDGLARGDAGRASTTPGHAEVLGREPRPEAKKQKVAVVGSGPCGLACAHDLALLGYSVTIFEAESQAGGMMRYGIPAYRLPREVIDVQVAEIEALGVEFVFNRPLAQGDGLARLREQGFAAAFLAVGAGAGRSLQLPGADLDGVVKAIDYLLNVNRGYRFPLGKRVVVVGGGLVALDAARMALRALRPLASLGREEEEAVASAALRLALDAAREAVRHQAAEVTVVSLESLAELPAAKTVQGREELLDSRSEGIRFLASFGPKRILGRDGRVVGIELVRCTRTLDAAGRFAPEFDASETRTIEADAVLLAIGQVPSLSFLATEDGVEINRWGGIAVDGDTLATAAPGVFSGGDAAFPPALLITAAAQGKRAARSIDAYLRGLPAEPRRPHLEVCAEQLPTDRYRMIEGYDRLEREVPVKPVGLRSGIGEIELGLTPDQAREQAARCLVCHVHPIYDGDRCILCARCADICPETCIRFAPLDRLSVDPATRAAASMVGAAGDDAVVTAFLYDEERCIRCGLCAVRCPTGAITMERFHFEETHGNG
jgi:NADPH-dependent glutamate synthase beta subunit-like oxidoreductase